MHRHAHKLKYQQCYWHKKEKKNSKLQAVVARLQWQRHEGCGDDGTEHDHEGDRKLYCISVTNKLQFKLQDTFYSIKLTGQMDGPPGGRPRSFETNIEGTHLRPALLPLPQCNNGTDRAKANFFTTIVNSVSFRLRLLLLSYAWSLQQQPWPPLFF